MILSLNQQRSELVLKWEKRIEAFSGIGARRCLRHIFSVILKTARIYKAVQSEHIWLTVSRYSLLSVTGFAKRSCNILQIS